MQQKTYTAILTKATDYHENDKLCRLLTLEGGIITAVMRGVKKPSAKLKFGAQQFAFCEYQVVTKGTFNTVTTCAPLEDFFSLTKNFDTFLYASIILEAADSAVSEQANPQVFILVLKAFKDLLYNDSAEPENICKDFLLSTLICAGYIDTNSDLKAKPLSRIIKTFEKAYLTVLNSAKLI